MSLRSRTPRTRRATLDGRWLRTGALLNFGLLAPLGLLGAWMTRERWRELWVFYGMICAYAASVALFYVSGRYRYPLVPLLMLFASGGVAQIGSFLRGATKPRLATAAVIVVGVAAFVNAPLYDDSMARVTTEVNLGKALMERGDLEGARKYLELALSLDRDEALAGDFPGAIGAARRGLELAEDTGATELTARLEEQLGLYTRGRPYVAEPR